MHSWPWRWLGIQLGPIVCSICYHSTARLLASLVATTHATRGVVGARSQLWGRLALMSLINEKGWYGLYARQTEIGPLLTNKGHWLSVMLELQAWLHHARRPRGYARLRRAARRSRAPRMAAQEETGSIKSASPPNDGPLMVIPVGGKRIRPKVHFTYHLLFWRNPSTFGFCIFSYTIL